MFTIASQCWLCRQPLYLSHHGICCFCLRNLINQSSCCIGCGLPSTKRYLLCGRCLRDPPCWQSLTFVSHYQPPISTLIKKMKFDGVTQLAPIELAPYFMMYTNLMTYPLKFRQHVLAIKEKLTYAKTASRFGVGMASLMRWNRRITPCTTHTINRLPK